MDEILVSHHRRPALRSPLIIEGLPGVGNVGKLAAEHLVDELGAEKFLTMHSKFLPPQVLVDDTGILRLVSNDMFFLKRKGSAADLVFLVGDYQGITPEGQYELAHRSLELLRKYRPARIYTLGGYGVGRIIEKPRVLGAATHPELVEEMKKHNVIFSKGEPGSGIIGASGLLLGLAMRLGIPGVCLMGETSGYFVDPKSARMVLEVLTAILGVKMNYTALEQKAQHIEKLTAQFKEAEKAIADSRAEDLRYIG
ncbi:MAG: proteasome assembly chaperone family protein [Euryarchaeota archaeon]|nr:proteasome assembly chaperone family protein [Euryarchaeota archaeon]